MRKSFIVLPRSDLFRRVSRRAARIAGENKNVH